MLVLRFCPPAGASCSPSSASRCISVHLGASRRILLAEPVRLPPSNRPATLLALEDNQSSANALESTRTTIHTNYRRGARLARRCVEVFPPLFRRTKPLTLPVAAPYSDADEEEAF